MPLRPSSSRVLVLAGAGEGALLGLAQAHVLRRELITYLERFPRARAAVEAAEAPVFVRVAELEPSN